MPSVSIAKGGGSLTHNNRDFIAENVDQERTKDNITYKKEPLKEAYERLFGEAIEKYNQSQKRADRRIDGVSGYMDKIRNSKNGEKLYYEIVVQIGNKFETNQNIYAHQNYDKVLSNYMRTFQEANPNLYVFNAVLHMDESTPHLHIDYIPVATGYKKGLEVRNSLDKALKLQGIDGKANKYENRTIAWQKAEKDRLEKYMNEYNLTRDEDKGLKRKHLTVEQYKTIVSDVRNEMEQLPDQIKATPVMFNKEKVTVNKNELEQLQTKAKLSMIHEEASKQLLADLDDYSAKSKERLKSSQAKVDDMLYRIEQEEFSASHYAEKYKQLYLEQKELNDSYDSLQHKYSSLKNKYETLKEENETLKSENRSLKFTLDRKIEELKYQYLDKVNYLCAALTDVVKSYRQLKIDTWNGYQVPLNKKQSRLFDVLENYVKKILEQFNGVQHLRSLNDRDIGFSKNIKNEMDVYSLKETSRKQPKIKDWDISR